MQEICLEQYVRAAKNALLFPTGTSRQHYNYLSSGDRLAHGVSSQKKPSTFILHSSSGREEEQCLGLLLDPDSREVLWDRFSVATLIVPSASVCCPIPLGWALAVAVGLLPLLAIRSGEQRKSDPAAYQSFAWSPVGWEPFVRAAVVYLSPTCLPL